MLTKIDYFVLSHFLTDLNTDLSFKQIIKQIKEKNENICITENYENLPPQNLIESILDFKENLTQFLKVHYEPKTNYLTNRENQLNS